MNENALILPANEPIVGALRYAKNDVLTELIVPEGVKVLGPKAFSTCLNLKTVHLPRSLTHIDMKCFEKAPLTDVYYAGSEAQWNAVEISPTGCQPLLTANVHFAATDALTDTPDPQVYGDEEAVFSQIRHLLQGGDGQFHIVTPNLCMENVFTKPGDMSLLIFPKGSTMLIDTGYFANVSKVMDFLKGVGLSWVDYFVFSHCDGDHVSNSQAIADYLMEQPGGGIGRFLSTGQVYGPYVAKFIDYLNEQNIPVDMEVRLGRTFTIDGVTLEILGPNEEDMTMDVNNGDCRNNQSMIMKFTYGKASYLTSGDLYAVQEAEVVRRMGERLQSDVWKTNHHGCFTSNTDPWLDAVGGNIVLTCSNDNGDTELAMKLDHAGVSYYTTGCHGLILVSANAEGTYRVLTQYNNGLRHFQRPQNWKLEKF